MSEGFSFEVVGRDAATSARLGLLKTPHGEIRTPAFMPVGTLGTVKGLLPEQVSGAGFGLILGNTYHLALRPGPEVIARHGGLHGFMGWNGAILTDSGGFQVYSLAKLRRVTDKGVAFRSHIDGSLHEFTPESVVGIQEILGSDIAMVLDVCPPSGAPKDEIERAVEITTAWAARSLEARSRPDQALFGIVQGGLDAELRASHAQAIGSMPFEGIAIGGLSVGEPPSLMYPVARDTAARLPQDRPRYLMGVGMPVDLVRCSMVGIDMFDCVFPTRAGRNGLLLTSKGRLVMKNARFRDDTRPPDPECECPTCSKFSRAYLRHLYASGEILGPVLGTIHNLHFYSSLMEQLRDAAADGTLESL
ncbi:MAG: tRNA guanosine(34) transglycosylase Tgt, partial [Deltaproteobacteria bacterium]|nr:tRNA guanosine(34) transglycosylase Tgt [Deltaproteobacteria bacterium]